MTNIKERILFFANKEGISYEVFFPSIGMSYGSFKGSAKKRPLNSDAIENILTSYPKLSPRWLITGEGDIEIPNHSIKTNGKFNLRTDRELDQQLIPLYDIEAVAGLIPLFNNPNQAETGEYISIPKVPKCDGAIFVTGDSMSPLLKSGDIVAYRKIYDFGSDIFWGEMYLISVEIAGEEYISVKYIQKSEKGEEHIKLVSENQHHQPKDVHLDKVRAMALVKASVRINSMG